MFNRRPPYPYPTIYNHEWTNSRVQQYSQLTFFNFFFNYILKSWKTPAVSTTDWMVETQLCKLRGTSYIRHAHWARLCYGPFICNTVLVNYIYDMVVDIQFNNFHGRPFARVLYVFLMKDIGRWLPWVIPGSTGRFYKDVLTADLFQFFVKKDVVHNHSAHGYYITSVEGGVRYIYIHLCMILLHVKQNKTKLSKKCHPYNTRIGSGYISYERQFEWWWDEQNRCT